MHLRVHLSFHFTEPLNIYKIMKKKMHFTLQLMIHLTVSSKCAPEGTFDGASKNALRDLHKGTEKGALEVALKGALEVALEFHLWLHLLMQ